VSPALGLGPTRGDPNFVYYNLKPAQDSPPMGCLQLSQGLQRILEHDKECYDLLKSCIAKFEEGWMAKETLFVKLRGLLERSPETYDKLSNRFVDDRLRVGRE